MLVVTSVYRPARSYGGPVESIHQLGAALAGLGVQVNVLTTDADGGTRLGHVAEVMDGVRIRRHRTWPLNSYGVSPGLWAATLRSASACDIVHVHGLYLPSSTIGLWAGRLHGKGLVASPHGALMRWGMRHGRYRKAAYLLLDRPVLKRALIHANSEAEAADARLLGFRRVCMVPNGVAVHEWSSPVGIDVRQRWGLVAGRPLVTSVGRFHEVKNLDLLLDATLGLGVTLVLAGDAETEYGRHIRHRVEAEHRTDVALIGYVAGAEKAALLQQTAVFASASHMESYGIAIAEALAAGCRVVCSEGAPWEVVQQEGVGRRVPGTVEAFRSALAELLLPAGPSREASLAIARRHAWSARAAALLEHYRALLAGGSA